MTLETLTAVCDALIGRKLTARYARILLAAQANGATMTELARATQCSTAAMTGNIDLMEKDGLVIRCRNTDRRVITVELTPKGRELLSAVLKDGTQETTP